MSGGKYFRFLCIYSSCSIGEATKKSLRLNDINCYPFFASEMELFKSNLVSMGEAAGDPGSSG